MQKMHQLNFLSRLSGWSLKQIIMALLLYCLCHKPTAGLQQIIQYSVSLMWCFFTVCSVYCIRVFFAY